METILEFWESGWGLDVILWFQSWRTPFIETLMMPFVFIGNATAYFLIGPLIYWSIDTKLGRRLVLVFLFAAWTNYFGKHFFARPRPFQASSQIQINPALFTETYGIPSGHTQLTTTFWGLTALEVKKRWVTIFAVALFTITAISRMVLGVHFPQDVILGFLLAGATIGAYAVLADPIENWLSNRTAGVQALFIITITALMLVIHPVLLPALNAEELSNVIIPVAVFFGAGMGIIVERRVLGFVGGGTLQQRVLRYAVGVIIMIAILVGVGILFDPLRPVPLFDFVRYGLVGLWISFGAPWLFTRLNMVETVYAG